MPHIIKEDGTYTQDNNIVQLLLKPNENQNFKEFAKSYIRNLYAGGYCYLYPYSNIDGYKRRLDKVGTYNSPRIDVLNVDKISFERNYLFNIVKITPVDFFYYTEYGYKRPIKYNDIIPFFDFAQDEDNDRRGVSRLISLENEINNIVYAEKAKTNKILQSGKFIVTPSTKSLSNGYGSALDSVVTFTPDGENVKQRDVLEDKLNNTGLAQDKSIYVATEELQVLNLMQSIQNYSYDKEVKEDKRTIKNTFQIPRELQNIGDDVAKYENRKMAELDLLDNIVKPLAVNFCESIKNYYDVKEELVLDYSHLAVMQSVDNEKKAEQNNHIDKLILLYDKGVISKEYLTEKLKEYEFI